jgi:hypothetical protein
MMSPLLSDKAAGTRACAAGALAENQMYTPANKKSEHRPLVILMASVVAENPMYTPANSKSEHRPLVIPMASVA